MLLLVMLASFQAVMKELEGGGPGGGGGAGVPWSSSPPQHIQDLNMNNANVGTSGSSRSSTPPGGEDTASASASMRFTALHVTMIFIAILLCVVICAIPWDNFKCGNNASANANTGTNSSTNQEHNSNSSTTDEEDARQLGLSKKMIKSFQVVRYGVSSLREKAEKLQEEGGGGGGGGSCWSECMICLSDFRNGQMVRILPHCSHGFHKKCIDQWLLSHTSCPICRNVLLVLNSPEKTFPPRRHHHLEQPRHPEPDQLGYSQRETQHEDRADTTPDVGSHDEDPPPPPPPRPPSPPPPPATASSVNHQDYQSVYRTYIVISD